MKAGIITLHKVHNFGSVLQAYSTCKVLERLGVTPVVIDYMEARYTVRGAIVSIVREVLRKKDLGRLGTVKLIAAKIASYFIQRRNFEAFLAEHIPMTPNSYTDNEQIKARPVDADVFVTGSDQVWNSDYNGGVDLAHYLDFAPEGALRISYAASFGKDHLTSDEKPETRRLLAKYSAISLRESSGVDIVSELGIPGARHVVDPTLLLDRSEWAQHFDLEKPALPAYLLIYSVERSLDELVYSCARRIADKLGLKIVFLSQAARLKTMKGCDVQLPFSTATTFLRYFCHADYVVASSFHGTAFAINFNREFISVLPPRFGARPRSLLGLTGLSERIVEGELDLEKACRPIDYDRVNAMLDASRKDSLDYLRTTLHRSAVA